MLDADQFKQVFVNLIGNAFYAMGENGRLTVRVEGGDHWVHIEVEDTGPGIPADKLERIFDPFLTTKPRGVGTGLELSVSHGVVSKHGGTITARSTVDEGTTFVIRIPARAPSLQGVDDA